MAFTRRLVEKGLTFQNLLKAVFRVGLPIVVVYRTASYVIFRMTGGAVPYSWPLHEDILALFVFSIVGWLINPRTLGLRSNR